MLAAGAVGITAAVTAIGVRADIGASPGSAVLAALARAVIVGIPLGVGLYAYSQPAHARFGRRLLLVSGLWFVAALSSSSSPLLYSVGRVAGWLAETGLVYMLLSFPDGRLTARTDQVLVAISLLVVTTLYLPTALLVTHYPAPSPWSACYATCPHNALMVSGTQPAFVHGFVQPFREALTAMIFMVVAARLAARVRQASSLNRRMLTPVLVVGVVRLAAFVALVVARQLTPGSSLAEVTAWIVAFATPALAAAFLLGSLRWHIFLTTGIRTVNAQLREMPGPGQVRNLLARAFEDPELEIASWSLEQDQWLSADGQPLIRPEVESERCLSEMRDGPHRTVAIIHDCALSSHTAFLETAAAAASVAFANDRIAARNADMVRELRASRARILASANDERRRIERDLHDGAQQRLVALYLHLELAAEKAEAEHPAEAPALRELGVEVIQALEEMRTLTRGIYPTTLVDHGLAEAVRAVALRSVVPTSVEVAGLHEPPREVAVAIYFCCIEALQNIDKHAGGAQSARIFLRQADSVLYFSVSDDGPGLPDSEARHGAGLRNMHDRMITVGGQLTVRSRPGQGTRVSGRVPLSTSARTPALHGDQHGARSSHALRRGGRTAT